MLRRVRLIGLVLASALAMLLFAAPAFAQDDEEEIDYVRTGFYLGANVAFGDSHFRDGPNFGSAWGYKLLAGYRAQDHFSFEAEYERFSHFLTRTNGRRMEIQTNAISLNSKIPFFTGPLQPYLKYGIGGLIVDNEVTNADGGDFMMRFGAGLDVYFSDHIALNTAVDYVRGFGDVRDQRYLSLSTGISYRF